jgi:hypothetical protein
VRKLPELRVGLDVVLPAGQSGRGSVGCAEMGPYDGGQAEYLRVPFADFNLLPLPPGDEAPSAYRTLTSGPADTPRSSCIRGTGRFAALCQGQLTVNRNHK